MRRSDALATLVAAVLVSTKVVLLLLLLQIAMGSCRARAWTAAATAAEVQEARDALAPEQVAVGMRNGLEVMITNAFIDKCWRVRECRT